LSRPDMDQLDRSLRLWLGLALIKYTFRTGGVRWKACMECSLEERRW
jgi:hypothetical protein